MVLVRIGVLVAWGCVLPAVWCLSLHPPPPPPGRPPLDHHRQQQQQQHQQQQRLLRPLLPTDLRTDPADSPAALNRLEDEQILRELNDPTFSAAYRLQQTLSQVAEEAIGGDQTTNDASSSAEETAEGRGEAWIDPRYYILNEYVSRGDETGSNNSDNSNSPLNTIREARNRRDSKMSSTNSNDASSNINTFTTRRENSKRNWPRGFSRRRSGLSLSIDASMKVLREALYLEIARKKQRQQIQRAQHNKALLNSIGKRDVSAQLSYRNTPTLADRN